MRLERLSLRPESPQNANALQGRIVGKTFLGSRTAVDLLIDDADGATLKAYVDAETDQSLGGGPVWIGWDVDNMAVLND